MADMLSIGIDLLQKGAGFARGGSERRIYGDANQVISRRHNRLSVTAIQHKILAAEKETIRIRPAMADSLVAGNADGAAASELRTARRFCAVGGGNRVRIQHAKPFLGRLPDEACRGIDQLIKRVVAEMIVVMASGKVKQPIIVGYM